MSQSPVPEVTSLRNQHLDSRRTPWLIEFIGPQFSGKSTIADLLALTLEENGSPVLRVETDNYVYNMFPIYSKLKVSGKFREARQLIKGRWSLLHDVISKIIHEGLARGYIVVHDHVNTRQLRRGAYKEIADGAGAKYLGVYVHAPLGVLKERWRSSNIPDSPLIVKPEPTKLPIVQNVMAGAGPRSVAGGLQAVKQGSGYFLVHMHKRYQADEVGFKILVLCDGKNTIERIAELAGTDPETVRKDIEFLRKAGMVEFSGPEISGPA